MSNDQTANTQTTNNLMSMVVKVCNERGIPRLLVTWAACGREWDATVSM